MKRFLVMTAMLVTAMSGALGVRNFTTGTTIPDVALTEPIRAHTPGMVLFVDSAEPNAMKTVETVASVMGAGLHLVVVDVSTRTEDPEPLKASWSKRDNVYWVDDGKRSLYGLAGVIVLPTVLFVTGDSRINSELAGERRDYGMFLEEHARALRSGTVPEDPYRKAVQVQKEREMEQKIQQASNMAEAGNTGLAVQLFQKLAQVYPDSTVVKLNLGYSLILESRYEEAIALFQKLTAEDDNPRYRLGLYFCRLQQNDSEENWQGLASHVRFEPDHHLVIREAARLLERKGRYREAAQAYRQAYRVLWKECRRSP